MLPSAGSRVNSSALMPSLAQAHRTQASRALARALLPNQGKGLPLQVLQPARAWDCSGHLTPSGLPHLSLHPQDQLHCVAHVRCRACFQPVRGRDSSSPFMTGGRGGEKQLSPLQEGRGEEGEGHHQSPSPPHFTADEWCGQFS